MGEQENADEYRAGVHNGFVGGKVKPIIVAITYGKQGEEANLVQLVYFNALDKAEKYVSSVTNEDKYTWTRAEII